MYDDGKQGMNPSEGDDDMTNGTKINSAMECPLHRNAAEPKEYDFGQGDATIYKHACGCACLAKWAANEKFYFANYAAAVGSARGEVARMEVRSAAYA